CVLSWIVLFFLRTATLVAFEASSHAPRWQWESDSDRRSCSFNSGYLNLASNQVRTFSHPQEANCRLTGFFTVCNSSAVVSDGQHEGVVLFHYRHFNAGSP